MLTAIHPLVDSYLPLAICKNTLPKGADYTQIYETFNNDTCQLIFKKLLFDVYNMNKIICSAFDDSNICPISGIVVSNVNLFMTPDFLILYKINTIPSSLCYLKAGTSFTENICFDDKYLTSGSFDIVSNIDFRQWAYLEPTTLLNVCKKNYNYMYAGLINYVGYVRSRVKFVCVWLLLAVSLYLLFVPC